MCIDRGNISSFYLRGEIGFSKMRDEKRRDVRFSIKIEAQTKRGEFSKK